MLGLKSYLNIKLNNKKKKKCIHTAGGDGRPFVPKIGTSTRISL